MAQVSFTIGAQTFAALDGSTNGRFALSIEVGHAQEKLIRHHVPGVDGNIIVRCGREGRRIVAKVRYRGADMATLLSYYNIDLLAWEDAAITIVDDSGQSMASCNIAASPRKLTEPRPTGRASGQVQMDIEYTFTQDG